jgi:inner membrane protein
MASAFGHAAATWAIKNVLQLLTHLPVRVLFLGVIFSILPDIDVIAFRFGIPYESMWGHRGITHSILFAFVLCALTTLMVAKTKKEHLTFFFFLFLATLSHSLLDALTTGGKGVAFFAPFDNTRYFFPWQVIKVSPIGVKNFFSDRGVAVLLSELKWIGIPLLISLFILYIRKFKQV